MTDSCGLVLACTCVEVNKRTVSMESLAEVLVEGMVQMLRNPEMLVAA